MIKSIFRGNRGNLPFDIEQGQLAPKKLSRFKGGREGDNESNPRIRHLATAGRTDGYFIVWA